MSDIKGGCSADQTAGGPMTVGALARSVGLSRSTLLYYDRVGLLSPSSRSPAGYRLYGERDRARLIAICAYREAGLSLAEIRVLLELEGSAGAPRGRPKKPSGTGASAAGEASDRRDQATREHTAAILTRRLTLLNEEIARLREQQRIIVRLMGSRALRTRARALDKRRWVQILAASGLDEEGMHRWHQEFEARAPEAHQDFLESLGIAPPEVAAIRGWARQAQP